MKEVMFSQPASGFIFLHNGKLIAAFQLMLTKKIWFSKDINQQEAKAILAAIPGLFVTIKSE